MSQPLSTVRALIRHLTPLHEAQERGLSERTIERVYECLLDVEAHLEDVEDEFDSRRAEAELVEAERDRPSRKPPL